METFKAIIEALQSLFRPHSRRWLGGVVACVGVIALLAPQAWFTALRLAPLTDSVRTWIAGAVLAGVVVLAIEVIVWVKHLITVRKRIRADFARLHHLPPGEQIMLGGYILENQRTQYFHVEDGVVAGLVDERILYISSTVGRARTGFAHNIQPWAWEYLSKHPNLVTIAAEPPERGRR